MKYILFCDPSGSFGSKCFRDFSCMEPQGHGEPSDEPSFKEATRSKQAR